MDDALVTHNRKVEAYYRALEEALMRMTCEDRQTLIALWRSGVRGVDFGQRAVQALGVSGIDPDFIEAFGIATGRDAFEKCSEFDPELRPVPDGGEERVVMGKFEEAVLYYVPSRHVYRVELGSLSEEFRATWEPVFGMDVDDTRMAEEVLDRLLAAASA